LRNIQARLERTRTNTRFDKNSCRNFPVRSTSLILAGIRADKHHHLTFPCTLHSGNEGWITAAIIKNKMIAEALVHRCGGSTLYAKKRIVFPV
jgi:hypothetical protein